MGWIADFFRFCWGLFYWNARKAWYRASPDRRSCPCQSPSDSGKAFETDCDASQSWAHRRQFRHLCPLLVETADGFRCSVDTRQVRPFWGRALLFGLGGALLSYLLAALLVFGILQAIGYPIALGSVVWPGNWGDYRQAKARYFFEKGSRSIASGAFREGTIALSLSHQLDPRYYEAGLALARFSTLLNPQRCDALFAGLMQEHPEESRRTTEFWIRSALARGNFRVLQRIALANLEKGGDSSVPFLHAFLFASRMLGDTDSLVRFAGNPVSKPWKRLLETELLLQTGKVVEATTELTKTWLPRTSYFGYYQTRCLFALGKTDDALIVAGVYQDLMPPSDRVAVQLAALALRGDTARLRSVSLRLFLQSDSPATALDILSTHLITYPDAELTRTILQELRTRTIPPSDNAESAYLAFFCAVGVLGDRPLVGEVQALIKERLGASLLSLNAAGEYFTEKDSLLKLDAFLPVFSLSLNTLYALHERQAPPPHATSPHQP